MNSPQNHQFAPGCVSLITSLYLSRQWNPSSCLEFDCSFSSAHPQSLCFPLQRKSPLMYLLRTTKVLGWKPRPWHNQIGSFRLRAFLVFAEKCLSKPDPGPCRAAFKNFYYNPDAGSCLEFFYGGCRGNGNRYQTLAECMDSCGKEFYDALAIVAKLRQAHLYCIQCSETKQPSKCLSCRWSACEHQIREPLDCRSVCTWVRPAFFLTHEYPVVPHFDTFFSFIPLLRPLSVYHPDRDLCPPAGGAHYHAETPQCPPSLFLHQVNSLRLARQDAKFHNILVVWGLYVLDWTRIYRYRNIDGCLIHPQGEIYNRVVRQNGY